MKTQRRGRGDAVRVAVICLARRGGMVHYHDELVSALQPLVSTIDVTSVVKPQAWPPSVKQLHIDTGRGSAESLFLGLAPWTWYRLCRDLRASKPDIVHIVAVHEWNPLVALTVKLLRLPLMYTVHDPEAHPGAPPLISMSNNLARKLADALVVLTDRGREQLLSQGEPPLKVHVIPMGVFSRFLRWKTARTKSENLFLHFGRIEPYKGVEVLLEAFGRISGDLPSWKLAIAGVGMIPAIPDSISPSRLELANRYIGDDEVAALMQRASIVVVPYSSATQSAVVATAYAFAVPVITTAVGGLLDMVEPGRTGLVVQPNDAAGLAKAMRSLALDKDRRRRMRGRIRANAETKWAWSGVARAHARLYETLLQDR